LQSFQSRQNPFQIPNPAFHTHSPSSRFSFLSPYVEDLYNVFLLSLSSAIFSYLVTLGARPVQRSLLRLFHCVVTVLFCIEFRLSPLTPYFLSCSNPPIFSGCPQGWFFIPLLVHPLRWRNRLALHHPSYGFYFHQLVVDPCGVRFPPYAKYNRRQSPFSA